MRGGLVYIITNKPNGTLYVGVTNNLARRQESGLVERNAWEIAMGGDVDVMGLSPNDDSVTPVAWKIHLARKATELRFVALA
jgi:putative endonuclease